MNDCALFETREEAFGFLNRHFEQYAANRWAPRGVYVLHHGEYERPDYRIRKVRGTDKYYILVRTYYYPGTYGAPPARYCLTDEAVAYLEQEAVVEAHMRASWQAMAAQEE